MVKCFLPIYKCKGSCLKIVWHPRKCPKVTFVDIFIEMLTTTSYFISIYISLIEIVSKKKFSKRSKVWTLTQDKPLVFEGLEHQLSTGYVFWSSRILLVTRQIIIWVKKEQGFYIGRVVLEDNQNRENLFNF